VLEEVDRTPTVTRVVLTSSCAAIYGDNADLDATPNGVFTEAVWNTSSSPTHQPYSYSKTTAEKRAWEVHDEQDRWRLVVMNPPGIFGPGVRVHADAERFRILTQLVDGTMATGAPRMALGVVDVRDVAEAHLRGAFLPDAEGRHLIAAHDSDLLEMGRILARRFPGYPLPTRAAPKFLLWLVGPFVNKAFTRKVVSLNIDRPWRSDNTKSREKLGMRYRDLDTTLAEHFQQLVDAGLVKPKKRECVPPTQGFRAAVSEGVTRSSSGVRRRPGDPARSTRRSRAAFARSAARGPARSRPSTTGARAARCATRRPSVAPRRARAWARAARPRSAAGGSARWPRRPSCRYSRPSTARRRGARLAHLGEEGVELPRRAAHDSSPGCPARSAAASSADATRTRVGRCGVPTFGAFMVRSRLSQACGSTSPGASITLPRMSPCGLNQSSTSGR